MSGRLLDTNIIIGFFNNDLQAVNFVLNTQEIYLSSVSLGELIFGAEKSAKTKENTKRALDFFSEFPVLLPTEKVAMEYGKIKAVLRKTGKQIPENDMWLAATALANDLSIVTHDKHFCNINGLQVDNI